MALWSLYGNDILARSSNMFSDEHTPKMKLFLAIFITFYYNKIKDLQYLNYEMKINRM